MCNLTPFSLRLYRQHVSAIVVQGGSFVLRICGRFYAKQLSPLSIAHFFQFSFSFHCQLLLCVYSKNQHWTYLFCLPCAFSCEINLAATPTVCILCFCTYLTGSNCVEWSAIGFWRLTNFLISHAHLTRQTMLVDAATDWPIYWNKFRKEIFFHYS